MIRAPQPSTAQDQETVTIAPRSGGARLLGPAAAALHSMPTGRCSSPVWPETPTQIWSFAPSSEPSISSHPGGTRLGRQGVGEMRQALHGHGSGWPVTLYDGAPRSPGTGEEGAPPARARRRGRELPIPQGMLSPKSLDGRHNPLSCVLPVIFMFTLGDR